MNSFSLDDLTYVLTCTSNTENSVLVMFRDTYNHT